MHTVGKTNKTLYLNLILACSLASLAASSAGCGDDGGSSSIGCEWFQGENCWKRSVEAAAPCAHESDEGVLSPDGLSCTYEDGTVITFGRSVDEADADDFLFDFEITRNDDFCMSYTEHSEQSSELVTSLGSVSTSTAGAGYDITCPDDTTYSVADPLSLIDECMGDLPGTMSSQGGNSISFTLIGGSGLQQQMFTCSR